MENKPQDQTAAGSRDGQDEKFNANDAYSGSGSMTPGGDIEDAARLSDYPDGNLEEDAQSEDSDENEGAGNNENSGTDDDTGPEGKTVGEATDPSKLSDI